MNKVLVIAVHPDDETLGCGGTILKHKHEGDEVHWLIATELKKSDAIDINRVTKRNNEIKKIANFFKFDSINRLNISATKVDEISTNHLVDKISSVVSKVKPSIIYLPFKADVHSDHRHIFDAAYSCTKSFRYPFIKQIYMMETLSETEFALSTREDSFIPNVFIDISNYLDKKIEAMKIYKGEMDNHPFPRSEKNIKAISTFRGASSGCEYAESFMLLKEIK
jgi:N-acetylglucosamine malate deacetylase 1